MGEFKLQLQNPNLFHTEGFIDGKWVKAAAGPRPFECFDKGTGKPFATCEAMGQQDVQAAVAAAKIAFKTFSKVPPRIRARQLLEFDRLLRDNKEDIAKILVMETGKPLKEALGEVDVRSCPSRSASYSIWALTLALSVLVRPHILVSPRTKALQLSLIGKFAQMVVCWGSRAHCRAIYRKWYFQHYAIRDHQAADRTCCTDGELSYIL